MLSGVDAPEAAHFGKEAQPYATEALQWLKREVEGKRLWVQLIRRDQYGRMVRYIHVSLNKLTVKLILSSATTYPFVANGGNKLVCDGRCQYLFIPHVYLFLAYPLPDVFPFPC